MSSLSVTIDLSSRACTCARSMCLHGITSSAADQPHYCTLARLNKHRETLSSIFRSRKPRDRLGRSSRSRIPVTGERKKFEPKNAKCTRRCDMKEEGKKRREKKRNEVSTSSCKPRDDDLRVGLPAIVVLPGAPI